MQLFYVANNQLPTKKAHGFQIMKMCEAFGRHGIQCELILPERGIDPEITNPDPFTFFNIERNFTIKTLPSLDLVKWQWIPGIGKFLFWLQQRSFAGKVKSYLKDKQGVVYSRDQFSLATLASLPNPLFWEMHSLPGSISKYLYQKLLKRLQGVVVITANLDERLKKSYHGKTLVAPDGVDLKEFENVPDQVQARQQLGIAPDAKIAIYTGQLFPWKGVRALIDAVALLPPDIQVMIVGGQEEDKLRLKKRLFADRQNQVIWKDFVGHAMIPLYLSASNCCVLTGNARMDISYAYTSPLKMFEYMASRRPIVAQKLPSFMEILNNTNSFLVRNADSQDMANGIIGALTNSESAKQKSEQAFQDVQRYTWSNRSALIYNFIHENSHLN